MRQGDFGSSYEVSAVRSGFAGKKLQRERIGPVASAREAEKVSRVLTVEQLAKRDSFEIMESPLAEKRMDCRVFVGPSTCGYSGRVLDYYRGVVQGKAVFKCPRCYSMLGQVPVSYLMEPDSTSTSLRETLRNSLRRTGSDPQDRF